MSAKFLQAFTEEHPELQRQIGCMTGIFQMFDRQHLITGHRRINGHSQKRLPRGHALLNSPSLGAERSTGSPQIILEKNLSKSMNENQRISVESSRTSFSSSSCSSFSSLDCNKSTQQDPLSFDRSIFPEKALKDSPKFKSSDMDARPPRSEPRSGTPTASPQPGRRSLDFRDVVKDSINRDSRGLSVKTSPKEEVKNHALKHRDSPRPMPLSKSVDGSYVIGINGNSRSPIDLNESLRVLVKLKDAPWNFSEAGELPRSSFESKGASYYPVSREAPRFSYDGRETSRQSLDSLESSKPATSKLRELPRLSLDGRESPMRSSKFDSKPNSALKDLDTRSTNNQRSSSTSNLEQESGSQKRSASVVAKLMGLEAMPSLSLVATQEQMDLSKAYINKDRNPPNSQRPKSSKASQDSKQDWLSRSPKSSLKDPITPRIRNSSATMKSITSSKVPIETAPWRQPDRFRAPRKTFGNREAYSKQQPESVYSEIERRLKELEFRQSNKDLRALKQILDAMQAKGLLESKKGEQQNAEVSVHMNYSDLSTNGDDQNLRSASKNLVKGSSTPRAFESPIVIMKPAKSINRSGAPPPAAIPLEGLSGLRKLQTIDPIDKKKAHVNNKMAKERTPKASPRALSADKQIGSRIEEVCTQKARLRIEQGLSRPQQLPKDSSGSLAKTSSSLSPRLLQRKLETERRSRPPVPSSDSSKAQRQSAVRQPLDSVSPRGRLRRKPSQGQESDDQLSECSETRNLSHQADEISQRSDSNISLASQIDIEVTSADRSADMNLAFFQQGSQSPSSRAARKAAAALKQKKSSICSNEDVSTVELTTIAPEQPSPISVLDDSFYQDDLPSPKKKSSNAVKDETTRGSNDCWNPTTLPETPNLMLSSKINHKKLQSIENLVQKLRELSSTADEPSATDHIASLCETRNPDHRYVSEILLASGLLLKDLSSGPMGPLPVQLHPSGHPINPDLFLVLEQTKTGWLPKPEPINESTLWSKSDPEKLRRKLVFDVVNEVLIQKLELTSSVPQADHFVRPGKLAGRFPSGQQLLKELCLEIEQLQTQSSRGENSDDDTKISDEDVLRRSAGWGDFCSEVPGLVLEIERSMFKDLIDEVVSGEAASGLQSRPHRRRRQLFAK